MSQSVYESPVTWSFIAILHGNAEEPHDPIVTTTLGGAYIERFLEPRIESCSECGGHRRHVRRTAVYEWVERLPAPEPFKGILVGRLKEIRETRP